MENTVLEKKISLTQIVKEVQMDLGKFEILYKEISQKVYFWCYSILGNEADAKDAAQEAMLRLYKKLGDLKDPESFKPWMYQLVRTSCLNYIQANKKKNLELLVNDDFNDSLIHTIEEDRLYNLPKEIYDIEELKLIISGFIDNLPRRQKEVITLFYMEEFKVDEIAKILNYNSGSVRSRLHSGRKNLEIQIDQYQREHNIKLYSLSLLPLIGLILRERSDEMYKWVQNELQFDQTKALKNNVSPLKYFSQTTLKQFLTLFFPTVLGATLIIGTIATIQNSHSITNGNSDENMSQIDKVNPYISNIVLNSFPTRNSVTAKIELTSNVDEKDIKVIFDKEEQSFVKKDKEVFVQAQENGVYTILIHNKQSTFIVKQLNPLAPQLKEVSRNKDHLQFIIEDELSLIDYEKSYVNYQGEKYFINNNKGVLGTFHGNIQIILYDKQNQFIIYEVNLD